MKKYSLNDEIIIVDDPRAGSARLEDCSTITTATFTRVEAVFRDHEQKLINLIKRFEKGAIFGCVAWLTSEPVLRALAKCENVQIIVQKEDFLRPDSTPDKFSGWKRKLRGLYSQVTANIERHQMRHIAGQLSVCSDPTVDGIRCVGNHNKDKNPAFPRAHHKFLVFCETENDKTEEGMWYSTFYKPVGVWTGSYNITDNATRSFENVVYLEDRTSENPLLHAYLKEHHQIFALSEPLDWTSDWCEPEYRIGT